MKHKLSKFKCGKWALSSMHTDDFIKHNKFIYVYPYFLSNMFVTLTLKV